jgi:hypothetical protein
MDSFLLFLFFKSVSRRRCNSNAWQPGSKNRAEKGDLLMVHGIW